MNLKKKNNRYLLFIQPNRQRHPEIKAFMAANGWGEDYTKLEQYYFDRLTTVTQEITQNQMRYIVWQERSFLKYVFLSSNKSSFPFSIFLVRSVLDLNITLPTGTIVEVWKGDYEGLSFNEELARVSRHNGHSSLQMIYTFLNIGYKVWLPDYTCFTLVS